MSEGEGEGKGRSGSVDLSGSPREKCPSKVKRSAKDGEEASRRSPSRSRSRSGGRPRRREEETSKSGRSEATQDRRKARSGSRSRNRKHDYRRRSRRSRSRSHSRHSSRSRDRRRPRRHERREGGSRRRRKRSWSSSRSASRSPGRSGARVRPPSSLDGVSAHLPVYQGMIAAAAGMLNATNPVLFGLPGFAQGGLGSSTVVQPEPTVDQTQVELFVGNTPPGISEIALLTFLNAAMNQAGLSASPGMPIVQCRVSNKFAFIRLRSVEETTKALSLNGIPLTGTYLMVKRPAKYTGPSVQAPTWQEVTGQGGNVVTDPGVSLPDKVLRELYVGNVNANMSEDSIKDFIGATMQQVGLNAKPGNPVLAVRNNGSFAFVEFRSVEEASNALNLDGIPLHGCNLRFSRPSKYEGPNEPHGTWELTLRAHLAKRSVPTRVLRIGNIVSEEDLKSESALQELEDETKEECEKLSQVTSVFLPRPNAATEEERAGVGYMWVCFESADGASAAMACLCLRTFEGRAIQAVFWDEEKYEKRDFRPDEEAGKEQVGSS